MRVLVLVVDGAVVTCHAAGSDSVSTALVVSVEAEWHVDSGATPRITS